MDAPPPYALEFEPKQAKKAKKAEEAKAKEMKEKRRRMLNMFTQRKGFTPYSRGMNTLYYENQ